MVPELLSLSSLSVMCSMGLLPFMGDATVHGHVVEELIFVYL